MFALRLLIASQLLISNFGLEVSNSLMQKTELSVSTKLDHQILHHINNIPRLIEKAKTKILNDKGSEKFLLNKFGSSVIIGSWNEILADWLIFNRTLDNFGGQGTLFDYGFIFFYGLGFGLPILDAAPSVDYPCGPGDFNKVIRHYGFHKGISSMIESPEQRITLSGRICELNIVLKTRLNCILSEDESFLEAAEVGFALDELIEAMEIRLEYGLKNIY